VNGDPLDPDYASPAEVRLSEHLTLLRSDLRAPTGPSS
jgi:hypothetical protein